MRQFRPRVWQVQVTAPSDLYGSPMLTNVTVPFRPRRHRLSATGWRTEMADRFAVWNEVTELDAAA
jgi:hypothetical protein